jgi:hypothetical protein
VGVPGVDVDGVAVGVPDPGSPGTALMTIEILAGSVGRVVPLATAIWTSLTPG